MIILDYKFAILAATPHFKLEDIVIGYSQVWTTKINAHSLWKWRLPKNVTDIFEQAFNILRYAESMIYNASKHYISYSIKNK